MNGPVTVGDLPGQGQRVVVAPPPLVGGEVLQGLVTIN
jgi:hypothetical protein